MRAGNHVKWYVDGRDYFWAVSIALEQAKESIYIADWWLSPELFLRRPPYAAQEYRLDKLIKRKAEEGVQIYVCVYKEVEQALTCNSAHTKHALRRWVEQLTCAHHELTLIDFAPRALLAMETFTLLVIPTTMSLKTLGEFIHNGRGSWQPSAMQPPKPLLTTSQRYDMVLGAS